MRHFTEAGKTTKYKANAHSLSGNQNFPTTFSDEAKKRNQIKREYRGRDVQADGQMDRWTDGQSSVGYVGYAIHLV